MLPTDLTKNKKRMIRIMKEGEQSTFLSLQGENEYKQKIPLLSEWTDLFVPFKNSLKFELEVENNSKAFNVELPPVRKMRFHVLMFSHVDYGYTSPVNEVWKNQAQYTKQAIQFHNQSKDLDSKSRFRWNVETTWALQAFLNNSTVNEKIQFLDLVKKGIFDVGSIYLHHYTDLTEYEELYRAFEKVRKLRNYGIKLKSCMLSDVPGVSEGFLDILASNSIKYLLLSINNFIAPFLSYTNLKTPFVWKTDNENEILVWFTEDPKYAYIEGYKFFGEDFEKLKTEIIGKMNYIDETKFSLDNYAIPMAIDNVPPIYKPVDLIERWNKEFDNPVIETSTVTSFFEKLEASREKLEKISGNFNGWWTSNILSYPRENNLAKKTFSNLHESAMLDSYNSNFLCKEIQTEFERLASFNEHSGGGGTYKSEDTFEILEAVKEGFGRIHKAYHNSEELVEAERNRIFSEGNDLVIINPLSFSRNSVVCYESNELMNKKVSVTDKVSGKTIPAGVFGNTCYFGPVMTEPFSYRTFSLDYLENDGNKLEVKEGQIKIENDFYRIQLDEFGNIISMIDLELNFELVEKNKSFGKILIARQKVNPIDNLDDAPLHDELYTGKSSEMLIEDFLPGSAKYIIKKEEVGQVVEIEIKGKSHSPMKKTIFLPDKSKALYMTFKIDYLYDIGPSDFLFNEWCVNSMRPEVNYTSPGKIQNLKNLVSGSGKDALTVLDAIQIADDEKSVNLALKGINLFDVASPSPFKFRKTLTESSNIYLRLLSGNMQNRFASPYLNGEPYIFSVKLSSDKKSDQLFSYGKDYRFQLNAFKAKSVNSSGRVHNFESTKNIEVIFLDGCMDEDMKILLKENEGKRGSLKLTGSRNTIVSICEDIHKQEFVKGNCREVLLNPFQSLIVSISKEVDQ